MFKLLKTESGIPNHGGRFNILPNRISSSRISLWYSRAHIIVKNKNVCII